VRARALIAILRDAATTVLAIWIAVNEELTGHIHPELLGLAGVLLGVPSATALWHLSRGNGETPRTPEPSPPSPSRSSWE
jgi:hypothetical protein